MKLRQLKQLNNNSTRLRQLKQRQDEMRRINKANTELAEIGGYIEYAVRVISLQYLVASMVDVLGAEIEHTFDRANLRTAKLISIQNSVRKATDEYYKFFEGTMKDGAVLDWANDLDKLEEVLYQFAGIKQLRPKRKAMREAKPELEKKYNVKLKDLK